MKLQTEQSKKIAAVLAATLILFTALICLFSSGCKYSVNYNYVEYEEGGGYYIVNTSGYTTSIKGELVIPSTYGEGEKQAPVKEIAEEAFRGSGITKLVIPATITKIGAAAFANCTMLEEVVFEEGSALEEIPQGMFGFDESLTKITLPNSVKSIGYRAFLDCKNLAEVILPENLKTITGGAFEECYALSRITLPEGLESIGSLAFYYCALTEIVIPDSVHDTQITVTDSEGNAHTQTVFGLGYGAFHTCMALKKAVVGRGITNIRAGVFGYCNSLEEIYIPSSVIKIEGMYKNGNDIISGHAFHNCTSLTTVYYAGTKEEWAKIEIDNAGYNNDGVNYNNNALFEEYNEELDIVYNKSYKN